MRRPEAASRLVPAALLALVLVGCGSPAPTPSAPPPSAQFEPSPSEEGAAARCPGLAFDAPASLDPVFAEQTFPGDQSQAIGRAFVAALTALYSGDPAADPCATFTGPGLESGIALDPRLNAAVAGTATVDGALAFRLANEPDDYDLRERPPRVPLDVVFDIPAGSTTTDVATGATDTSERAQRVALHVTFAYDGTRWLADRVAAVSPEDAAAWALPRPVTSLRQCKGFRDDPDLLRFDERAGYGVGRDRQRPWCADDGRGGALPPDLVSLTTRFPCDRGRIASLTIGLPLGTPIDRFDRHAYVRDPDGQALAEGWITEAWKRGVRVPDGAEATGWTNGNMDLWIDPSEVEAAVYVRTAGRYERWPRGDPSVTDCN